MATDQFQGHDYYNVDDLLTDEHKMVRDAARDWVKKEVSPIILVAIFQMVKLFIFIEIVSKHLLL